MKKIFFLIDTLGAGGSERVLSELANFKSNHYEVYLITINQPKNVKDFFVLNSKIKRIRIYENLKGLSFISRIYKIILVIKKLRKLIVLHNPSTIISFLTFSNLVNILSSLWNKKHKCLISERINPKFIKKNIMYHILSYIFYRYADNLIVQSNIIKKSLHSYNKNIVVIENHVRDIYGKNILLNKKRISFLNISRLDEQKNIFFLIQTFEYILIYNRNIKLNIIGDGELKEEIRNYIKKKDLKKNIVLLGKKKNIDRYLKSSNFYIHSAKTEGMSNAILEAMSANVPCIILKHRSQHNLLKNNKNCFIIQTKNKIVFAEEILKILKFNNFKIKNIINSAKKEMLQINLKKISKKWENLF